MYLYTRTWRVVRQRRGIKAAKARTAFCPRLLQRHLRRARTKVESSFACLPAWRPVRRCAVRRVRHLPLLLLLSRRQSSPSFSVMTRLDFLLSSHTRTALHPRLAMRALLNHTRRPRAALELNHATRYVANRRTSTQRDFANTRLHLMTAITSHSRDLCAQKRDAGGRSTFRARARATSNKASID